MNYNKFLMVFTLITASLSLIFGGYLVITELSIGGYAMMIIGVFGMVVFSMYMSKRSKIKNQS